MRYAKIIIMCGDRQSNSECTEVDGDLEQFIKDECYSEVDNDAKALVYVTIINKEPDSKYFSVNYPDGELEEVGKETVVDNLVFIYDDAKQTLDMIPFHKTHKNLTKTKK